MVRESIRDRVDARFSDGGLRTSTTRKIWRWRPGDAGKAVPVPMSVMVPARKTEGPSIAVLAFENMSGGSEQAYFSDGIAKGIITDLSKVARLTVIARNSSFSHRVRSVDLRSVGRGLGVGFVLESSVRKTGGRACVTAQLIDAATGGHVWADRDDGDLADVFAARDAVTLQIVQALKVRLSPSEQAVITRVGTANPQAHDAYLHMRDLHFSPNLNKAMWARDQTWPSRRRI
jgi:adenylate cyclase